MKKKDRLYTIVYSYTHMENGNQVTTYQILEHMKLKHHNKKTGRITFDQER